IRHGSLGYSYVSRQPVRFLIGQDAPVTASLVFGGAVFWLSLSIPVGILSAVQCSGPVQWAYHMILPWVTFMVLFAALYVRLVRANVIETMSEDYVRTARAKGASQS